MTKRRGNPKEEYTTDEARTAQNILDEGALSCVRDYRYKPPLAIKRLLIRMCDKEALEPAARVFGTTIRKEIQKRTTCRPDLFPPDGKGIWVVTKDGKPLEQIIKRLDPLLTKEFKRKWKNLEERCIRK